MLRLVLRVETDLGEALSDERVVEVRDDLMFVAFADRAQDAFIHDVTKAATSAYREAVGK